MYNILPEKRIQAKNKANYSRKYISFTRHSFDIIIFIKILALSILIKMILQYYKNLSKKQFFLMVLHVSMLNKSHVKLRNH